MEAALRRGVDVVVGTCGRVMDLLERGALKLNDVSVIILDEADEMLNMGFADDVEKILQSVDRSPTHPIQTLLFSATIPSWVQNVAKKYLKPDHKRVDLVGEVAQKASADVSHYAIACHWSERNALLKEVIAAYGSGEKTRTIVFTETKKVSILLPISHSSITTLTSNFTRTHTHHSPTFCMCSVMVCRKRMRLGCSLRCRSVWGGCTETSLRRRGRRP